ncbi:FAR1-related sequence 5 [Prunus dulcis]|uniref:Protein FAR1-RELATED SEQUENCE n=1 Tax=Prunus dulcis TaxID=3755 RepID=A0A4Y1QPS3_PRUDU|nr:FAR1-related sequence 5 [Prunus dulcis]
MEESMEGRKPKTIFTDQCQAMANGIEKVFPQSTWDDLLAKFNLTGNLWLKILYSLRAKWCPIFSQHLFTAKIKSSQRSESTNNVFHRRSTKTMSLTQFVHHYDKQAEKMRSSELEESFRCNQGLPSRIAKSSGLLNHAATIYTRKIFKLFEKEFVDSLGVMMHEVGSDGTIHSFEQNEGHKRRNTLMRTAYDVLTKASETENTTRIALQKLREIVGLIEKEMIKSKGEVNANIHDSLDDCNATTFDETPVQNPSCVRPKGISNARLKSVMEKRRRKTSKDIVSSRKTKQPNSIDELILLQNKTSITKERRGRRKNGPVMDFCARLQPGDAKHSKKKVSVTQSQSEPQTGRIQGTIVNLIRIPGSHGPGVPETREANVKCIDKTEGKLDVRGHHHIRRQHILKATCFCNWVHKVA